MNPFIEYPRPQDRLTGRILAIEPDLVRAKTLEGLLCEYVGIDLEIVASIGDAMRSLTGRRPDLVLTSTFLPPSDEAELTAHLKQVPGASHVQVIIVPHFIDQEEDEAAAHSSRMFGLLRRRPARPSTACDRGAVLDQIEKYLEQARATSILDGPTIPDQPEVSPSPVAIAAPAVLEIIKPELRLVRPRAELDARAAASRLLRTPAIQPAAGEVRDRRRARRRPSKELPWLWSAKLPSGAELTLVDVSNTGVLVETAAKIALGSTIDLRLVGQETNVSVPARILRSEVSQVDARGVKYHVAAAFARHLDLLELEPGAAAAVPDALVDLLGRALGGIGPGSGSAATPCARFEQELRRLVPARDIQIRRSPMIAAEGTESVYFTVPGGSGSILQAIFERNQEPSAMEFRLLKAAASLAAVVLQLTPSDGPPSAVEVLAG